MENIYATESVLCIKRWLWQMSFFGTSFKRDGLWAVSYYKKYSHIKYKNDVCTLYFDCFVFCTKDTCNLKWQLASLSKDLHSLPDTVLNVGKMVGSGISNELWNLLGSNSLQKEAFICILVEFCTVLFGSPIYFFEMFVPPFVFPPWSSVAYLKVQL